MLKKQYFFFFFYLIIVLFIVTNGIKENKVKKLNQEETEKKITERYNKFVVTTNDSKLYTKIGDEYKVCGSISKDMILELEKQDKFSYKNTLFKLENVDYYINYQDVIKSLPDSKKAKYENYKTYIPFNETVYANKIYVDDNRFYNIDNRKLTVIIKENDRYYSEYDKKLVYVKKEDIIKTEANNNNLISESIPILNYHYVIAEDGIENKQCLQGLCHTEKQFNEHMEYIKANDFYTPTMTELEMFFDGKINLPKKSVIITLDDGWYISRAIKILESNKVNATLFLIGSLISPDAYKSPFLEIHSHSYDLHKLHVCKGGLGGAIRCSDRKLLLNDLKKSRESLNNTTVFCYPFYEYNDYAKSILKEAGFTMAFIGGNRKATRNIDKLEIPRYRINNKTTINDIKRYIN